MEEFEALQYRFISYGPKTRDNVRGVIIPTSENQTNSLFPYVNKEQPFKSLFTVNVDKMTHIYCAV